MKKITQATRISKNVQEKAVKKVKQTLKFPK